MRASVWPRAANKTITYPGGLRHPLVLLQGISSASARPYRPSKVARPKSRAPRALDRGTHASGCCGHGDIRNAQRRERIERCRSRSVGSYCDARAFDASSRQRVQRLAVVAPVIDTVEQDVGRGQRQLHEGATIPAAHLQNQSAAAGIGTALPLSCGVQRAWLVADGDSKGWARFDGLHPSRQLRQRRLLDRKREAARYERGERIFGKREPVERKPRFAGDVSRPES